MSPARPKRFSVATGLPPSAEEATSPADAKPARARRPKPAPADPAPELDEAMLGRWRWQLGATARKAAAARARADTAMQEWERLVADAAAVGVPERLVEAAALDADVPVPKATR